VGGGPAVPVDAENLPDPDVIAGEIAEDLRSALEQIEEILGDLSTPHGHSRQNVSDSA